MAAMLAATLAATLAAMLARSRMPPCSLYAMPLCSLPRCTPLPLCGRCGDSRCSTPRPFACAALLHAARTLDRDLDEVRQVMREGMSTSNLQLLEKSIARARQLGLGEISHYELPAAVHHAQRVRALIGEARAALTNLEDEPLQKCVADADKIHLQCEEIAAIRELLALPADKLLTEQLRAAARLGDGPRQDTLQMRIKDHFFERCGDMFAVHKFPHLRTAEEFANAKLGLAKAKAGRRDAFLRHQAKPLHISLTQLDRPYREDALKTFKCVLGFMGDAPYQFPLMLVQEVLSLVLTGGSPDELAPIQTVRVRVRVRVRAHGSRSPTRISWS